MPPPSHILCPVDFSSCSEHAAHYAIDFAANTGASVTLLHAWEVPIYAVPDGAIAFDNEVLTRVESSMQTQLEDFARRIRRADVHLSTRVEQGAPATVIPRVAGELGVDLVIVGTHGRTGLSHLLMGSVAERVVRTSHVPVLTVPLDRPSAQEPASSATR
jgi:nucleotide-binding universal stress UspA family protein